MNRKFVCVILLLVIIGSLAGYEMMRTQNQTIVPAVTLQTQTCEPLFYWTISGTYTTTIAPYSYSPANPYSSPLLFDVKIVVPNVDTYTVNGVYSVDAALQSMRETYHPIMNGTVTTYILFTNKENLWERITVNGTIDIYIAYHAYGPMNRVDAGVQLIASRPLPIQLYFANNLEGSVTGSGYIGSNYQGFGALLRLGNPNPVSVDVTYSPTFQGYAYNTQNNCIPPEQQG